MRKRLAIVIWLLVSAMSSIAIAPASVLAGEQIFLRVVGVASNDVLNVRQYPSGDAPIVGMLRPGTTGVTYLGEAIGDWRLIALGQLRGWAHADYLQKTSVAGWYGTAAMRVVGVASNDVLNVRASPDARAPIIGLFAPYARCVLWTGDRFNEWVLVESAIDGNLTRGWVNSRFLAVDRNMNLDECD